MTDSTMTLLLDQIQASTDGDFLRAIAAHTLQRLMEFEVDGLIGAGRHERSDERTTYRNGHRDRQLETRLGTLDLKIPKLRQGTYFPAFLEPRKTAEKALTAVIQEAWIQGVSTRKVDDLVQALGMTGISKSQVSALCQDIDTRVLSFLERPLDGEWPYLWLDATYIKLRQNGRIVSIAAIIATGVNQDGRREILGLGLGQSEAATFWIEFLRGLVRRGLKGVKLVISDAHEGLKAAITQVLSATWQRCRVHTIRTQSTLCASVPEWRSSGRQSARRAVAARQLPGRGSARVRRVHPNEVCPCRDPEARRRRGAGRSGPSSSAPAMALIVSPAPIVICSRPIRPNPQGTAPTVPTRSSKEERHARRHLCPRLHRASGTSADHRQPARRPARLGRRREPRVDRRPCVPR